MFIYFIFNIILWFWFLGCVTTYKFGECLLVEGVGIKSPEFKMLSMFSIAIICNLIFHPVGKWILLAILTLWFVVQFRFHWYYTIFGASEKKLKGYNECFEGSLRLFPVSETRLIPDFYHIVLHLLILINIVICILV